MTTWSHIKPGTSISAAKDDIYIYKKQNVKCEREGETNEVRRERMCRSNWIGAPVRDDILDAIKAVLRVS